MQSLAIYLTPKGLSESLRKARKEKLKETTARQMAAPLSVQTLCVKCCEEKRRRLVGKSGMRHNGLYPENRPSGGVADYQTEGS